MELSSKKKIKKWADIFAKICKWPMGTLKDEMQIKTTMRFLLKIQNTKI